MKKILIVNNNLDMGGIQKALINLLKVQHSKDDITLLLFSKSGALLQDVPDGVKIITPQGVYKMLGLNKAELKRYPFLYILKGLLMKYAALFSRKSAMKLLGIFQKKIKGYDTVISYSHLTNYKSFANGCGDFVLDKTECSNKVCVIHCDYLDSGYMSFQNNKEYNLFDKIACCSDSVKNRFIEGSGISPEKVYTLRNFFDNDIIKLSEEGTEHYDDRYINIVSVARLSVEKGIDRAIEALYKINRTEIRYFIIGDGPQKKALMDKVSEYGLTDRIFFLGEQKNPYRYMAEADYLLVPSVHEAAPIVFDEAKLLGVQVITTNTTSAEEMVKNGEGFVCQNTQEGIEKELVCLKNSVKKEIKQIDNTLQQMQFAEIQIDDKLSNERRMRYDGC